MILERRTLAEVCTVPVLLVYTCVQPIPTVALEIFTGPRSSYYSSSNVEAQDFQATKIPTLIYKIFLMLQTLLTPNVKGIQLEENNTMHSVAIWRQLRVETLKNGVNKHQTVVMIHEMLFNSTTVNTYTVRSFSKAACIDVTAHNVLLALADWSRVKDEICLCRSRQALVSTDGGACDSPVLAASSLMKPHKHNRQTHHLSIHQDLSYSASWFTLRLTARSK